MMALRMLFDAACCGEIVQAHGVGWGVLRESGEDVEVLAEAGREECEGLVSVLVVCSSMYNF